VSDVVPESKPLLFRVRPAGSVPDARDQVYGVVPPVALNVAEYAVPAVALESDVVVTASGGTRLEVTVTFAFPDLVESAVLVAITVAPTVVVT
jgi:hypothetical protein